MANNNISPTPSTSLPYFVPRIVMIGTYTQSTQTPITSTSNNFMQTDTSTFNTSATQTRPFQSNQTTQTYPQHNTQAIQTDLGLNENLTLDSTNSSTSTDLFDETVQLIALIQTESEKSNKVQISNKCSHTKQRQQVTFNQEHKTLLNFPTKQFQCQKLVP